MPPALSAQDRKDLKARGLTPADARRQARLLIHPPSAVRLLRPCRAGDGLERFSRADLARYGRLARAARLRRRFSLFVPASGAASRLFEPLYRLDRAWRGSGRPLREILASNPDLIQARVFLNRIGEFALAEALGRGAKRRVRDPEEVLRAILSLEGPCLAGWAKARIPFHRVGSEIRTAFEEHFSEAQATLPDAERVCRLHFTVPADQRRAFRILARKASRRSGRPGPRFLVRLSVQSPATDTLSVDERGRWVRSKDGRLLFRPGGHGALLANLERSGGDIVFVKNVDNVPHPRFQGPGRRWRSALAGRLISLQAEAAAHASALEEGSGAAARAAARFLRETVGASFPASNAFAKDMVEVLDRPWRVCAMVRDTGQPGGGPFWVIGDRGPEKRIVEASEAAHSPSSEKIMARAAYFNPVDMVLGLRDRRGRPHDLSRYADPSAVIVTGKTYDGKRIRVLEWPGLWNGGMARWNTVFVEIPARLFYGVKTITDLLRPGHRGSR